MILQEKLNAYKADFKTKAPKEALEIMHRSTDKLRQSGIMQHDLKVGDRAPDFTLKNDDGGSIALKDYLDRRPLVLSFYRGKW